jgi:hypothetical protein
MNRPNPLTTASRPNSGAKPMDITVKLGESKPGLLEAAAHRP